VINLFQPSVGAAELAAVGAVFASSWLGVGPVTARFEAAFGAYVGRSPEEFVSLASCTEGLFQAVAALGLGPGDEVVLPTISFVGAAHAVRATGARVVLCDVDPSTLNPTVEDVRAALTPATRAVLVLHYGGDPGHTAEIAHLAAERTLWLIEDAAIGLGSTVAGQACGTFGDVGVWSFDSMKVMTGGDGGMVWCRDPVLADRIRSAVRLGVTSSGFARPADERWWEIEPSGPGRRATMNDVAAAIATVQLERLPEFLCRRAEVAAAYDAGLADLPWLTVPPREPHAARAFFWLQTAERDRLAQHLRDRGVYSSFRYWPLHRMRMYGGDGAFPDADHAAATTLQLPLHQRLSNADVDAVIDAVRQYRT